MNITNITVTKTAEEKTENASYVLEGIQPQKGNPA